MNMDGNVLFVTENEDLQKIYDAAEEAALKNIRTFGKYEVLVEGAGYPFVWLETQPMGGEMYAKRNIKVALNNQLIFMENQREDGRLPGIIRNVGNDVVPGYNHYQGYCFPYHAVNMYYLAEQNKDYLEFLYDVLERFDNHLWRERCNNDAGCLELWCEWDTGEDNCKRLADAPHEWEKSTPPEGFGRLPYHSMDIMGYSHEGRTALAEISEILNNGRQKFWQDKALEIRRKMKDYLWREDKGAFFDRDCNGDFIDCLFQGNIKAMYFGCMDAAMAERFIREHLFNPREFFTPMPLTSVAADDKYFENVAVNSWSGQVQSLNYQRIIRALENYGKYYELTVFAKKYFEAIIKNGFFPQQFDPFTGIAKRVSQNGGYGPAALSVLEFISRLYGVHINREEVWFGCHGGEHKTKYTQKWSNHEYTIEYDGKNACGFADKKRIFKVTPNVRVITDHSGNLKRIINTSKNENNAILNDRIIHLKGNEIKHF